MSDEMNPEIFDIDGWLTDAHLPEESCRVWKRGDLLAELSELQQQIEDEQAASGQSLASAQKLTELTELYEKRLEEFGDSALTVYVRAIPRSRMRQIKAESEELEKAEGWDRQQGNVEFGYALLAEAVVAVKPAAGERQDVSMSRSGIKALEDRIGSAQLMAITEARKKAESQIQEPDAVFLRKPSGDNSQGGGD